MDHAEYPDLKQITAQARTGSQTGERLWLVHSNGTRRKVDDRTGLELSAAVGPRSVGRPPSTTRSSSEAWLEMKRDPGPRPELVYGRTEMLTAGEALAARTPA